MKSKESFTNLSERIAGGRDIRVLGIGNALVDVLVKVSGEELAEKISLPKGSMTLVEKTEIDRLLALVSGRPTGLAAGGSAANTIHGLACLGLPGGFIGKIGRDEFGSSFAAAMSENGVTLHLSKSDEMTGICLGLITEDCERTFATFLGAAVGISADDLRVDQFHPYSLLHVEGYLTCNHSLLERALSLAAEAGLAVSLDLASFNVVREHHSFLEGILNHHVDIVFANEDEAEAMTGCRDPEKALDLLAESCSIAVVKTGKNGSLVRRGHEKHRIEAITARAVDSTGAGDLYAAGFLFGLARNLDLPACGRIGSLVAGRVVETIGAKLDSSCWNRIHGELASLVPKDRL